VPSSSDVKKPDRPVRVVVEAVTPEVDAGRFAVKGVAGDPAVVEADVFGDGHDLVAAALRHRRVGARAWTEVPMAPIGNDRWGASFTPVEPGGYEYSVAGWVDRFGSWRHGTAAKVAAGQHVEVELAMGAALVGAAAARSGDATLAAVAARLAAGDPADVVRDHHEADDLDRLMWRHGDREPLGVHERILRLEADRERAACGAWYELFPRSWGDEGSHGTFDDVAARLGYVASMGFDVLYLPPVHPIGRVNRKGPNNTPAPGPDDPGSPWAIGATEGGHTAVHPELGGLDGLRRLRERAHSLGMELALDIAFQCAPDHPWVTEHPDWFRHRPDGTIQYAENPPKRYEDIYPLDFESVDWRGLWDALADVVRFWIGEGVRIFRVDNPHTKALPFWEWLIASVRRDDPGVVFLAEAFTRPKVMYRLAKSGFTQSYTYFTWRPTAWELRDYLTELSTPPVAWFFRPNFWPTTPDILTPQMQRGDAATFSIRAVLAATLAANYGVYGPAFELRQHAPRDGVEEYLDNEKYQLRAWELDDPGSLRPLLARLNAARACNRALRRDHGLHFHPADNPMLLCYSKTSPDGADRVLCVVNTDPDWTQSGWLHLDLGALGLAADATLVVRDFLTDDVWHWHGPHNYVSLDPSVPAHVFAVAGEGTP
jgi:starch synthase (maltosyl-transferring)